MAIQNKLEEVKRLLEEERAEETMHILRKAQLDELREEYIDDLARQLCQLFELKLPLYSGITREPIEARIDAKRVWEECIQAVKELNK